MFNRYTKSLKISLGIALLSFAVSTSAQAQLGDAGEILRAGSADANALMESYLNPFGKGFGSGMNTGWFNTASAHKKFGFDITINAGLVSVPSVDQVFDLNSLNLTKLEVTSGPSEVATLSGESGSTTTLGIKYMNPQTNQEEILTEFEMPGGTGIPYVPSPMVQATLGLIKDTDISLRLIPESEIPLLEDSKVSLFGLGFKHGINQWLPGGKVLPFDLSVQFGFTNFKTSAGFDVNPEVDSEIYNPHPASKWEGQGIELETKASTYNVIIGKTIPLLSVYAGVGMENSTTTLATPGSYPITAPNSSYSPAATPGTPASFPKTIEAIEAPIDLEFVNSSAFRAFAGTRIKLAILQISASYTLSTYSSFNVGFGITFR